MSSVKGRDSWAFPGKLLLCKLSFFCFFLVWFFFAWFFFLFGWFFWGVYFFGGGFWKEKKKKITDPKGSS